VKIRGRFPQASVEWTVNRRLRHVVAGALLALVCAACAGGGDSAEPERARAEQGVAPLVTRADRSRARGDFAVAIDLYSQAYQRTPWNERLKQSLAVAYTEKAQRARSEGELRTAEQDLRAALALYPDDASFKRNLAIVLLESAQREMNESRAEQMLAELRTLAPDLEIPNRVTKGGLERRLDLAFQLLERGQLDAGVQELELVRRDYPGEAAPARFLAQAIAQQADAFTSRQNFSAAGEAMDRAVALYKELLPCDDAARCKREEFAILAQNRVIAWSNAFELARARAALDEAKALGFAFPELEKALEGKAATP
jgi:tetratricopeptide (TPR) repeat protein